MPSSLVIMKCVGLIDSIYHIMLKLNYKATISFYTENRLLDTWLGITLFLFTNFIVFKSFIWLIPVSQTTY